MVARITGASLGLFAFAVAMVGGLVGQNPMTVVLSRGIFALFVFFLIGLGLGAAAEAVVADHTRAREAEILRRESRQPDADAIGSETGSAAGDARREGSKRPVPAGH